MPGEREAGLHGEREREEGKGARRTGEEAVARDGVPLVTDQEGGARRRPDPLELGAAELEAAN